jgi:anti-anti-sigma regulatory factor
VSQEPALAFPELLPVDGRRVFGLPARLGPVEAVELHRLALSLSQGGGGPFAFDCGAVEVLGGAVLQVLLALQRELVQAGSDAILLKVPPAVARTLAQAGIKPELAAL